MWHTNRPPLERSKAMKHVSLPLEHLQTWATFNDIKLYGTKVSPGIMDDHGSGKGGGLLATCQHESGETLLTVPGDLVLSRKGVEQCAKADQRLRELLDATAFMTQKPRMLILVFLVYQMTMSSPDAQSSTMTAPSPLTDYVKMLPKEILLPTFYTPEERDLLVGTSLSNATNEKLVSLEKEFEQLRTATASISWCQKLWWDEDCSTLEFDDWKLADATYRSRALELPKGVGDAMVPVVDMANHSYEYNARFEVDRDGQTLLVVRDRKKLLQDEEITIIYGCGGACEMIFSYGFLEDRATSAREMFLSLPIPEDDPLRVAKISYAKEAPGIRLYEDENGHVQWESEYVWWACVNEEDGLDFTVLQATDGSKELKALWKGHEFQAHELRSLLMTDELRDIFVLRATMLILQLVESQGMHLAGSENGFENARQSPNVRACTWKLISKLRELELNLITTAYEILEAQKAKLLEADTVRSYLGNGPASSGQVEEDFS